MKLNLICLFYFVFCSDHHIPDVFRSSSENLSFSISRLLSKTYSNNNISNINNNSKSSDRKSVEKDLSDSENGKLMSNGMGLQYTGTGGLYSYPIFTSGGVLRVPPQGGYTPQPWALPPLHPAALAHQAFKDRLAGELKYCELKISVHIIPGSQFSYTKQ